MKKNFKTILCIVLFSLGFQGISSAQVAVKIRPVKPKVLVIKPSKAKRGHTWRSGHWKWHKKQNKYVWTKARWMKNKKGRKWVSGHWNKKGTGNKWIPGHWK